LRRLVTAPIPTFYVFIEFDGFVTAQRAYIVHIDEFLIKKVLKRIHEIGQGKGDKSLNKRKMTIQYNDRHKMNELDGNCLKQSLLSYMGQNISDYISWKQKLLKSAGFEDSFAHIKFDVVGDDNLNQLIDVSLGISKQVSVVNFRATHTRFGIKSNIPFVNAATGMIEMPALKPESQGFLCFKEDKLSRGLSFKSKLYISALNPYLPDELKKIRLEGDFFDIKLNPFRGDASYTFTLGDGIRLPLRMFRDALRLINLLSSPAKNISLELNFEGYPIIALRGTGIKKDFDFLYLLPTIEHAVDIVNCFDLPEDVDISLNDIMKYKTYVDNFHKIINSSSIFYKVEFTIDQSNFDTSKEVSCILLVSTPIGSYIVGILMVLTGQVTGIGINRYVLITTKAIIEKKICSKKYQSINKEDLFDEMRSISDKYGNNNVVIIDN
jgi:hypothetical protein